MDEVTCEHCKGEVPRWAVHTYRGDGFVDQYICVQCQLDRLLTAMGKDEGIDVQFADGKELT